MQQSKVTFYGGAGAVTGSNFLLDTGTEKILVDCGLAQGTKEADAFNQAEFPYDASQVNFLVVTHAHLDHVGRIPKLVKAGFTGTIYSTDATRALAEPMLRDELALMTNEHPHKGEARPPLFDEHDLSRALGLWKTISYHEQTHVGSTTLEFFNSGHILGSAMAKFSREGKSILFTGDLGGGNSPLLPLCEEPAGVDYLVIESVYGNRTRNDDDRKERLENVIEEAAKRGGTLLIPAFSTERTQDLLYVIRSLMHEHKIPSMPVYLDSPLAEKITAAFSAYPQYFNDEVRKRVEGGEDIFRFPELKYIGNVEESRNLLHATNPKIILAGSGMAQGGRVVWHESNLLPDPKTTVLVVGYQAAGTLGRRLVEGTKELTLYGERVKVAAHIEQLYGYSAHMDGEQLVEFANKLGSSVKQVFVVMGEPAASSTLVQRLRDFLSVNASAPEAGESATIDL